MLKGIRKSGMRMQVHFLNENKTTSYTIESNDVQRLDFQISHTRGHFSSDINRPIFKHSSFPSQTSLLHQSL
jgi:hypothetical protein